MEMGNMLFGNSRGPVEMPYRELVDSDAWTELMKVLQIDDYHCIMGKYYNGKKRDNGLEETETGGYRCVDKDGNCLFEIFPYWWNGCTCDADAFNEDLDCELNQKYDITLDDWDLYFNFEIMDEDPTDEQKENYQKILEKIRLKNEELESRCKEHDPGCYLLKHNFVYRPGTEDEFWIDWYKYPFRDSYMSKEMEEEDIKHIFEQCVEDVKSVLKEG